MAGIFRRLWGAFNPPQRPSKDPNALRFGILGAANIAPLTLINPAKSHAEVIVQAVAARDRKRAEEFAKAHGIPDVKDSYEEILEDPNIDCVFIPLPNGLHFEWAVKAIRAGKHVLLEKPAVSNAEEAGLLFNMPELSQPNAPILLEAFHSRFYPAWLKFVSLIDPPNVVSVKSDSMIPWWGTSKTDIHFNYNLSGGGIMAMGTYNLAALRVLFGAEPDECLSCSTHHYTDDVHHDCDWDFKASFRFPNGGIGEASTTLRGPTWWTPSTAEVQMQAVPVPDESLVGSNQEKFRTRKATLHGVVHGIVWHRIDVEDTFEIRDRDTQNLVKTWTERWSEKAYTFQAAGKQFASLPSEEYWMSFRHQLEQFVNKIKGRDITTWIDGEESIKQMRIIDMAYVKSGLGSRPSSNFMRTMT